MENPGWNVNQNRMQQSFTLLLMNIINGVLSPTVKSLFFISILMSIQIQADCQTENLQFSNITHCNLYIKS